MTEVFMGLADLDRTVHEPARLAILTVLAGCDAADFVFLHRITGLTRGNLSGHLSTLERAAMVTISKGYQGKIPNTRVQLTNAGRTAIDKHWDHLDKVRRHATNVRTDRGAIDS